MMKRVVVAILAFCLAICVTSCQKQPEPIRSLGRVDLYREEGYQSKFTYFIETHDVEGWGPEMFGINIFTKTTRYHTLLDPNGEANVYSADQYKTKEAKQEFTSAEPLTWREINDLVSEFGDSLGRVVLSDCVDGTYVFVISGYYSRLYPKYASKIDKTEYQFCLMLGEATSKEELSLFCLLSENGRDNIYIGFAEGKTFYCKNGEFRKWGEEANYGPK